MFFCFLFVQKSAFDRRFSTLGCKDIQYSFCTCFYFIQILILYFLSQHSIDWCMRHTLLKCNSMTILLFRIFRSPSSFLSLGTLWILPKFISIKLFFWLLLYEVNNKLLIVFMHDNNSGFWKIANSLRNVNIIK